MSKAVPPPGSPEAVAQGCTCPIKANRQGKGVSGVFTIIASCPVHVPGTLIGKKT